MIAGASALRGTWLAVWAAGLTALSFGLPLGRTAGGEALRWPSMAAAFVFACFAILIARPDDAES